MSKRSLITLVIGLLVMLSGCTTSQKMVDPGQSLFPEQQFTSDFQFPDEICGCMKKEILDFESSQPGLGYAIRYGAVDAELDFYIYDAGFIQIPSGINQAPVPEEFFESTQFIRYFSEKGIYRKMEVIDEGIEVVLNEHPFLMSKIRFQVDGLSKVSYTLVTGIQNKILKIRATIDDGQDDYGQIVFDSILQDIEQKVISPILVTNNT